jgi:uncharacterized damage-inducible protein DinB
MEAMEFITQSLRQVQLRLLATCEGLTQEQVLWRPGPTSNNIGWILWHVARGEDRRICSLRGHQPMLWVSEGWHQKFGQPVDAPAPGDRMGLRSLPIPDLSVLIDFAKAAHQQTMDYLPTLTAEGLDVAPNPSQPEHTVAAALRHLVTHKNNHHGQIDFIRGLQDEAWDLPPGTGVVLPPLS